MRFRLAALLAPDAPREKTTRFDLDGGGRLAEPNESTASFRWAPCPG